MADVAVTNTFVANTTAVASQVNTNFTDLVNYINARNGGSTTWDIVKVTNASAVPLIISNGAGTNNIANFQDNGSNVVTIADGGAVTLTGALSVGGALTVTGATTLNGAILIPIAKRRPNLVYASATAVDVENNTGTSNQTTITFPDGDTRSVTEDTSSTHKYRRFLITATAEFTSGTEDSGLRNGLSEATNTWYAIYAVKSAINTANFVLAGDTTLPLQANFSTLETRYGTSGWVYLGMIRNGDNSGATGDIVPFTQSGATTMFSNSATGAQAGNGVRVANTASATSLTYTYAAGTGAAEIPNHASLVHWTGACTNASTTSNEFRDSNSNWGVFQSAGAEGTVYRWLSYASAGAVIDNNGNTSASSIFVSGLVDNVLGSGRSVIL